MDNIYVTNKKYNYVVIKKLQTMNTTCKRNHQTN